jgi:hypothetical protein
VVKEACPASKVMFHLRMTSTSQQCSSSILSNPQCQQQGIGYVDPRDEICQPVAYFSDSRRTVLEAVLQPNLIFGYQWSSFDESPTGDKTMDPRVRVRGVRNGECCNRDLGPRRSVLSINRQNKMLITCWVIFPYAFPTFVILRPSALV